MKKFRAIQNPKPTAIVVHCIDPRFPEAMEKFIEEDLHLNRYVDVVMKFAGGPTPLAYPTEMPSRCKWLRKHLEFNCAKFSSIESIIAIAHKNCAYYSTVPAIGMCGDDVEKRDLPLIGNFLQMTFPKKEIQLYHAKLVEKDSHVLFEKVELPPQKKEVTSFVSSPIPLVQVL